MLYGIHWPADPSGYDPARGLIRIERGHEGIFSDDAQAAHAAVKTIGRPEVRVS